MPSIDTETVVVGMSGGVDSSVSAALLLEQGYKVIGLFMKNWEEDDDDECNATEDLADAQAVCDTLEIPLRTVNFSFEYWERVFAGFLRDLRLGKTPNPDIICNVEIKFREFPQWAMKLGADYVATGHYARIGRNNGTLNLLKGVDQDKDQTYFLYGLNSDALQRALFPIGKMTKQQVRSKAHEFGFDNHDKKGSTGICFIGREKTSALSFVATWNPPKVRSPIPKELCLEGTKVRFYIPSDSAQDSELAVPVMPGMLRAKMSRPTQWLRFRGMTILFYSVNRPTFPS